MKDKRNLHLFDTSQYISAGRKGVYVANGIIEDDGKYRPREMPCGGISYLLNTVYEYGGDDDELVYCFDRPPLIKREIHSRIFPYSGGYKGTRPKKDIAIGYQRRLAEEVIKHIGLNAVAVDNLESDDCIASLVKYYKDSYEHIYIHSTDSDLFYLVCGNVEIVPLTKGYYYNGRFIQHGKKINMLNWEDSVKANCWMPYDTLTIEKIITGDSGDNIPGVSNVYAKMIMDYIPKSGYEKCGDNVLLRKWIAEAVHGDETVMGVTDLIMPIITDYENVELQVSDLDREVCETYAGMLQCKYVKNTDYFDSTATDIVNQFIDEYIKEVI